MKDDTKRKLGVAEAATGAGIAMSAPNQVYRIESRHMKRKLKRIDTAQAAHAAKAPSKPTQTKDAKGNTVGVPKEAKAQYIKDIKAHQKAHEAFNIARKGVKPKVYPKQTALWLGSAAVGGPMMWHGMRTAANKKDKGRVFSKRKSDWSSRDADAAAVGAGTGFGVYQGGAIVASKPYEHRAQRKIRESPEHSAKLNEHKKRVLGDQRAKIETGDRRLRRYFREYPNVPGGKFRRTVSRTHAGKSGAAATAVITGLSGAAGVNLDRKIRKSAFGVSHG